MRIILLYCVLVLTSLYSFSPIFDEGKELYKATCISCHGENGKGNSTIKLVVKPRDLQLSPLSEQQSYKIIKFGAHYFGANSDIMPSFKEVYNEHQLHALAYYITHAFQSQKEDLPAYQQIAISQEIKTKMLHKGKKIYRRNCSWCHGTDAKGDGEATHNPELSIFPYNLRKTLLNNKQIFLYAKHGGKFWGTYKNDMPNWFPKYDDFILKSVTRYIEETFQKGK